MSPLRVVAALVFLVAATLAEASVTLTVGERVGSAPRTLLSVPSASGGALAVRADPSPAPARDAQGLPVLSTPVAPRSWGAPRTAESSAEIIELLTARPHRQRGPPFLA